MKNSKIFIDKILPVRTHRVASKSIKGDYHLVSEYFDGRLDCDCLAGMMKRECRHKRIIINKRKKLTWKET